MSSTINPFLSEVVKKHHKTQQNDEIQLLGFCTGCTPAMFMQETYLVFWVAIAWGLPLSGAQVLGPFDMEFRVFELCPDVQVKNPMVLNTKYSKVGRKKVAISFDVNARYPISDNITHKLDFAVKTSNGFKHNYFNMEGPLVTTLKTYVPEYYKRVKFPVAPGNYSVKNLVVEPSPTLIKTFFYSTFKVICHFYHKNELLGCIDFIVQTAPKRKS